VTFEVHNMGAVPESLLPQRSNLSVARDIGTISRAALARVFIGFGRSARPRWNGRSVVIAWSGDEVLDPCRAIRSFISSR